MKAKDGGKREGQGAPPATNGHDLRRALDWIVCEGIFAKVRLHGNVKWRPRDLVRLAIIWVWCSQAGLVEAANDAIALIERLFGKSATAIRSYQVLTAALMRYTAQLLPVLWTRLQALMQQTAEGGGRIRKWLVLALDGSRVGLPRTKPNEDRFNKPRKPRKKKSRTKKRGRHAHRKLPKQRKKSYYNPQAMGPQMWLTLMWHVGLRLPWCWKLGPSYSSERAHVQELLEEQKLPENTLICADAGFVGYDFWQSIVSHGHSFLIRVGGNVRLLKNLGVARHKGDIVYCWPDQVAKKEKPPLVLRLFCFNDGRGEVYLVTNVLDDNELNAEEACEIYRKRWGIELQFRSLKQTYGRGKLRARTPGIAEIEMHWSLLGLTMLQLLAVKEQTKAAEPAEKTSVATVLKIIREMMTSCSKKRPANQSLRKRLQTATTDSYKRHGKKQSRNYPRRKTEPHANPPVLLVATTEQREKARKAMALLKAA